jgi:hypothetical protein
MHHSTTAEHSQTVQAGNEHPPIAHNTIGPRQDGNTQFRTEKE